VEEANACVCGLINAEERARSMRGSGGIGPEPAEADDGGGMRRLESAER
jgi:hypothetical protein